MSLTKNLWANKPDSLQSSGTNSITGYLPKYVDSGDVVNSKIRKFFFFLQEKKIERDLRVTISVTEEPTGEKQVVVELTNDLNPVFLFTLCITKQDFENLRSEQGINVEFNAFPEALASLLDQCVNNDTETEGRFKLMLNDYCSTAAGCRIMDMQKIQIKIVEECAFKNICHLTLDIMRGTEAQIRKKLELEIFMVKQAHLKKSKVHDETLMKVVELEKQIAEQCEVIGGLNDVIKDLHVEKEEEVNKERSHAEVLEKHLRDEYDEKLAQERETYQMFTTRLQNKLETSEKELKLRHENEMKMQTLLHEKERDKELIEMELISRKQELNHLRSQNEKLDVDYHDRDKTVNILRTRLAVTEQELKDNDVILLNHQNKVDELIEQKNTLQKEIDFLKDKRDKKETALKKLTDEILKANEIISKQQSKNNMLSNKINEYEGNRLKLEQALQIKENALLKQNDMINRLQKELDSSLKNSNNQIETITSLQKVVTEMNDNIKTKTETIVNMRENFKSHILKNPISPQKSLLYYRDFVSMPTLLPSDEPRCTNDLWSFLLNSNTKSSQSKNNKFTASKTTRLIKPFIYRYLKRFVSVPVSIFRSNCNTPLSVLISPEGSETIQSNTVTRSLSQDDVRHETEYAVFQAVNQYAPRVQSDTSVNNIKGDNSQNDQHSVIQLSHMDAPDNKPKFIKESSEFPRYAPVGAFRLKPVERFSRVFNNSYNQDNKLKQESSLTLQATTLRKTPAVKAPPLTAEQRNESTFRGSCSQRAQANNISYAHGNNSKYPSVPKLVSILKPSSTTCITKKGALKVQDSSLDNASRMINPLQSSHKVATSTVKNQSCKENSIPIDSNAKMSACETSGLSEPSAYFAS